MKQKAFSVTKYSDLRFGLSLRASLCDILSRPGVHIITLVCVQQRWTNVMMYESKGDRKTALALIDNCDKNVADEK